MSRPPFILLVNPWITDFAAHDLWAKPLGLRQLASLRREGGCRVAFVDCLEAHEEDAENPPGSERKRSRFGTGKYPRIRIPAPAVYEDLSRPYHRYGIFEKTLRRRLERLPEPDLVWVGSMMTYWYPGVRETVGVLGEALPQSPLWLGGVYARLCPDHARRWSGADRVVVAPVHRLPSMVQAATGFRLTNEAQWRSFRSHPLPALDLVRRPAYAPLLTSLGCPFHCPYCASRLLQPRRARHSAARIHREIVLHHACYGLSDFAFYDDALLLDADTTLKPALRKLCEEGYELRFHTPNALHVRALTEEWCRLLFQSGFATIRLGLETTHPDHQRRWGGKVETDMFRRAMDRLRKAGFTRDRLGVYLLCGLPGQTPDEVARAVHTVRQAGGQPHLAEYSPIPGTPLWEEACGTSSYDLQREPLYHNNTFFACRRPDFTYKDLLALKDLARRARR